jgi:predicted phosphodiesterase
MRIAVLSDIHANRVAFEAVRAAIAARKPDRVVVAGDAINRGPEPRPCLEALLRLQRNEGWLFIKGNHEDYVLDARNRHDALTAWERDLYQHTEWTLREIHDLAQEIERWPDQLSLTGPDGSEVRFVHASMRGNRCGIYADMEEPLLVELTAPPPAVLVAGHTHIPFIKRVNGTLIVNAGAAGLPFDGNPDASFAIIEWDFGEWRAEIIRIPYDRAAAERAFTQSTYIEEGGPLARLVLEELRHARPRIGVWHRTYERAVAAGQITMRESVERLLKELDAAPV